MKLFTVWQFKTANGVDYRIGNQSKNSNRDEYGIRHTSACIGTVAAETKGNAVAKLRTMIRLAVNDLAEGRYSERR